jgi:hypothetical protein
VLDWTKFGMGSAELPAISPGRPPKSHFSESDKFCQYLAYFFTNKRYSSTKQANNLTSFQTNQIETSWCCLKASICAPPDHPAAVDALWSLKSPDA